MSDKVKPWHQRKPKHHGKNERHKKSKFPPNGGKRYDSYPPQVDDRKNPPQEDWDDQPLRW